MALGGNIPDKLIKKTTKSNQRKQKKQSNIDNQSAQNKSSNPVARYGSKGTSTQGLKAGDRRVTFILPEELYQQIRNCAYWERMELKHIANEAFEAYLKNKKTEPYE